MTKKPVDKGGLAEEAIRHAFLRRGYIVVRGPAYRYSGFDVTDVDLFLYGVTGAGREVVIIDVKNKKTPQAMERIFWALGLCRAVQADRCLVATSDTNPSIIEFGRRFGVEVLDGHYLRTAMEGIPTDRIPEETFFQSIVAADAEQLSSVLLERYKAGKSRLLTMREFDVCNANLRDVGESIRDLLEHPARRESIRRVLYALASFLCISLDFQWSKLDFVNIQRRSEEFERGLRYGSSGRQRIDEFILTLKNCRSGEASVQRVVDNIEKQIESGIRSIRTNIVADFVGKQGSELFPIANVFDQSAFALTAPPVNSLPTSAKGFLFMIADYFQIDRSKIGDF